jgi:hypothetical protein
MLIFFNILAFIPEIGDFRMVTLALGVALFLGQLSGPGASLPQILRPEYKAEALKAGRKGEVTINFGLHQGFVINHTPPISLKLNAVSGLTLEQTSLSTPVGDPKSKDEYYVDVPVLKVPVMAAKAGKYEIPGKLRYFFCSKSDGFCSVQDLDVRIPINVQ